MSYSSALRDAQAIANSAASNPPSPGFPSVLAVASSLASSLRASSAACYSNNDNDMPEDYHLGTLSPQHLHLQGASTATSFLVPQGPLCSSSTLHSKKRIGSFKRSLASCASAPASTSRTGLEDFLRPRPSISRASSTDSFHTSPYIRTDSESLDWEPVTASGLVSAADADTDTMDEDLEPTLQRTSSHHIGSVNLETSSAQESSLVSEGNRRFIARSFLLSPSGRSSKNSNGGGIRYSMGVKKGCPRCERGDKGHFTHLDND